MLALLVLAGAALVAAEPAVLISSVKWAHCYELTVESPSTNQWWAAHGYQYKAPQWALGPCTPSEHWNYFNSNQSIAEGVTETMLGFANHSAPSTIRASVDVVRAAVDVKDSCIAYRHDCKKGDQAMGMFGCLFVKGKPHNHANLLPQSEQTACCGGPVFPPKQWCCPSADPICDDSGNPPATCYAFGNFNYCD